MPRSTSRPIVLSVTEPFRLDLTANVLRRLSTNLVDAFTPQGRYLRAIATADGVVVLDVRQPAPDRVELLVHGARSANYVAMVSDMLGLGVDLRTFGRRARTFPWLAALYRRMRGVKPPHYPELWETFVNGIVFQQISIHAAASMMGKLVRMLSAPVIFEDVELHPFPTPQALLARSDDDLRACSLSAPKIKTLRIIASAFLEKTFNPAAIAQLPSPQAIEELSRLHGIGPWTAALVLLRGLGRLDVFPVNDSGVAKSLRMIDGAIEVDFAALLERLGDQRGMLYYLLLLGRLEKSGVVS